MKQIKDLSISLINVDLSGDKFDSLYPLTNMKKLESLELILMGCNL